MLLYEYSKKKKRSSNKFTVISSKKQKILFENLSHRIASAFNLNLKDVLEGTINESRLKENRVCNSACCYVTTSNYTHVHFPGEETTASDD